MIVTHHRSGRMLGFTLYYLGLDGSIEKESVRVLGGRGAGK